MSAPAPLLRPGLLAGIPAVAAGTDRPGPLGAATAAALATLGAEVRPLLVDPFGEEEPAEAAAEAALAGLAGDGLPVLVWDAAAAFAAAGDDVNGVRAALDGAWLAIRPVATRAMIPGPRGGKVLLLAPPPGGAHAEAARAGLENLARTPSIEWARFGIRLVAILPGADTAPDDVGQLAAYLASRAGDYYAGCVFSLAG